MLVPGLLAGLDSIICGLWTHSLLFKGPVVFNRQRYGHKSLLSDKNKIKTFCHSMTVGSVKRLVLHALWHAVTHISGSENKFFPSCFFSSSQLSVQTLARACECLAPCAFIHSCWPWERCARVCAAFWILCLCLFPTSSALMRQVTVWVWAMEQSVSRPTDYRLALHDNRVGRTLVDGTKKGEKKGQWMEDEEFNGASKGGWWRSLTIIGFWKPVWIV